MLKPGGTYSDHWAMKELRKGLAAELCFRSEFFILFRTTDDSEMVILDFFCGKLGINIFPFDRK
jgi:hypothetical protein